MRIISACLALAVLASFSTILASPARADGTIMGRFNCQPQVPCDLSDPFYGDTDRLVSIGSACISRYLSLKTPDDGFFDVTSGLDDKGCLTNNPNVFQGSDDGRTAPQCCITPLANGACVLHCNVITE